MPQTTIYSTGPAAVIVWSFIYNGSSYSVGGLIPPTLLGWCERSPETHTTVAATPLFNTLGGVELPYMYFWQGSESDIGLTLTRWNDIVLSALIRAHRSNLVVAMSTYHGAFLPLGLAIVYPLMIRTDDTSSAWGEIFPAVRLARSVEADRGAYPRRVTVLFHAFRLHLPATGIMASGNSAFDFYGSQVSGFTFDRQSYSQSIFGIVPSSIVDSLVSNLDFANL